MVIDGSVSLARVFVQVCCGGVVGAASPGSHIHSLLHDRTCGQNGSGAEQTNLSQVCEQLPGPEPHFLVRMFTPVSFRKGLYYVQ
jgi:hypothetical protein